MISYCGLVILPLHHRIILSFCNSVMLNTVLSGEISINVTRSEVPHPLHVQLGKTALHVAAAKGNAEMVSYMMQQVNPNVDAKDGVSGNHNALNVL